MIYEEPMMEMVLFEANDIFTLTTSGDENSPSTGGGDDHDISEWL